MQISVSYKTEDSRQNAHNKVNINTTFATYMGPFTGAVQKLKSSKVQKVQNFINKLILAIAPLKDTCQVSV